MNKRTIGERLVEGLAARGVEVVFGIPGVHTVELYRGLSGSPVRHVTARHEQGCCFMADGYTRISGKPGVAFVITGPGVTNSLTAMAQARADSIPMLVISGVNARATLGKGLGKLHELPDQAAMVATLCPTRQILGPQDVGPVLDWAFATMSTGRPGPVHIEVPTDVMPLPCPSLPAPVSPPIPDLPDLSAVIARLNEAERVTILAGGGCRGREAELLDLAEALDAPVVQTILARGMMHGHALCVPASPSLEGVRRLMDAPGVQILAIGTELGPTDYDMNVTGGLPDLSGMIRIDICPDQLARHTAAIKVKADAGAAMAALTLGLSARKVGDGAARAATARISSRGELGQISAAMPGQLEMIEAIRRTIPGALIVGDSTQGIYASNLYYDHDVPGGYFNASIGYGALGYGPGAAVGAALARPDRPVICVVGDGGLQFSPGELRTAVDENLNITFVVWNNAAFMEIADAMRGANTEVIGCTPSPLKMEPFALACDLPFQSVSQNPELFSQALSQPQAGPRMIEVRVGI